MTNVFSLVLTYILIMSLIQPPLQHIPFLTYNLQQNLYGPEQAKMHSKDAAIPRGGLQFCCLRSYHITLRTI